MTEQNKPVRVSNGLLARIDLNLVIQGAVVALLLWLAQAIIETRDASQSNAQAIGHITEILDRMTQLTENPWTSDDHAAYARVVTERLDGMGQRIAALEAVVERMEGRD